MHTPPGILIEHDSIGLSEFCSPFCFNDLVGLCQEVNIRGHATARYPDTLVFTSHHTICNVNDLENAAIS